MIQSIAWSATKEVVPPQSDVLKRQSQRLSRLASIFNALNRECESPTPVKIDFHDNNQKHTLISRIIASCDNGVIIEGGLQLPLCSIYSIRIL